MSASKSLSSSGFDDDGKQIQDATYFTDCREDAIKTCKSINGEVK